LESPPSPPRRGNSVFFQILFCLWVHRGRSLLPLLSRVPPFRFSPPSCPGPPLLSPEWQAKPFWTKVRRCGKRYCLSRAAALALPPPPFSDKSSTSPCSVSSIFSRDNGGGGTSLPLLCHQTTMVKKPFYSCIPFDMAAVFFPPPSLEECREFFSASPSQISLYFLLL